MNENEKKTAFTVLDYFEKKSAADLEAYTTLDFVAHTMLKDEGSEEEVIRDVLKIKSKKFTYEELLEKYRTMKQLGYIA